MMLTRKASVGARGAGASPAGGLVRLYLTIGAWLCAVASAHGHAALMEFIRHDATITVDPRNIDIELTLTFHEIRSLPERRRMDRDHDGGITPAEREAYLAARAESFAAGLRLTLAGRPVELITLYDPQIDLLGGRGIELSHHVLRLTFFARTPPRLTAGSVLELSDALWPGAPALDSLIVRGEDGVQMSADAIGKRSRADLPGPLLFRARCEAIPDRETSAGAVSFPRSPPPDKESRRGGIVLIMATILTGTSGVIGLYHLRRRWNGG